MTLGLYPSLEGTGDRGQSQVQKHNAIALYMNFTSNKLKISKVTNIISYNI